MLPSYFICEAYLWCLELPVAQCPIVTLSNEASRVGYFILLYLLTEVNPTSETSYNLNISNMMGNAEHKENVPLSHNFTTCLPPFVTLHRYYDAASINSVIHQRVRV